MDSHKLKYYITIDTKQGTVMKAVPLQYGDFMNIKRALLTLRQKDTNNMHYETFKYAILGGLRFLYVFTGYTITIVLYVDDTREGE